MRVTRIERDGMSHVEPPLDSEWSDRKRLEWHAAVAEYDTGVPFAIHDGSRSDSMRTHYTVQVGGSAIVLNFDEAWLYIIGASTGAKAAGARGDHEDHEDQ